MSKLLLIGLGFLTVYEIKLGVQALRSDRPGKMMKATGCFVTAALCLLMLGAIYLVMHING